ncbi:MAG: hypothetical protein J5693_05925 [Bacteroidales bacterium]|nr:hypothetical protein [Bacteroidales bacterium]
MESVLIFVFWMLFIVIAAVIGAKKKARQANTAAPAGNRRMPGGKSFEEWLKEVSKDRAPEQEIVVEQASPQPKPAAAASGKAKARNAASGLREEGIRTTEHQESKPAAETPKKSELELDFDPAKMVVYSEILKPGYEKY